MSSAFQFGAFQFGAFQMDGEDSDQFKHFKRERRHVHTHRLPVLTKMK